MGCVQPPSVETPSAHCLVEVEGILKERQPCRYGEKCRRKEFEHRKQFSHVGDPDYPTTWERRSLPGDSDSPTARLPRIYGEKCFKKDSLHRERFSHRGDGDGPAPVASKERPPRESGEKCSRKDLHHRERVSHPGDSDSPTAKRPPCCHGEKCYRKDSQHREQFSHPGDCEHRGDGDHPASVASKERPPRESGEKCSRKDSDSEHHGDGDSPTSVASKERPPRESGEKCSTKDSHHRERVSHPGDSDSPTAKRPPCCHGEKCYRKDSQHREQFSHPADPDYPIDFSGRYSEVKVKEFDRVSTEASLEIQAKQLATLVTVFVESAFGVPELGAVSAALQRKLEVQFCNESHSSTVNEWEAISEKKALLVLQLSTHNEGVDGTFWLLSAQRTKLRVKGQIRYLEAEDDETFERMRAIVNARAIPELKLLLEMARAS